MAQAINQALDQALERDERVVLFGEDIADPVGGLFTCTAGLSTRFGTDRVRATPIAEAMLALVLMDHYLRHRGQNADVVSETPIIPATKK